MPALNSFIATSRQYFVTPMSGETAAPAANSDLMPAAVALAV